MSNTAGWILLIAPLLAFLLLAWISTVKPPQLNGRHVWTIVQLVGWMILAIAWACLLFVNLTETSKTQRPECPCGKGCDCEPCNCTTPEKSP